MRAYKVQNASRSKRVGIVANSFADFRKKGCDKLKVNIKTCHICLESDGTEVDDDDYFQTLPANTVLVFLEKNEEWQGYSALLTDVFSKLLKSTDRTKIASDIRDFLNDKNDSNEKYHLMSEFVSKLESNTEAEERSDDLKWFEGVDSRYQTKDQVMKISAQGRIRKYLTGAKEHFEKDGNNKTKAILQQLIKTFQEELKWNEYYGDYFRRSANKSLRLCDDAGWFLCKGAYDVNTCQYRHSINPYSNKEARVLFSTWNLDHVIEKSRDILPSIIKAVRSIPRGKEINWEYFYELLFTTKNLKLVHIACHKKGSHEGHSCNPKKFYIKKS
ncbi:DNA fragmentation factor subunit beta-like [Saccoglossus kowalevskii]|uniref:DNAation factor subunit beta-like n=1 Tax=Saccoglossus kowalevskii TaxID=10224 RepID=A0ABM0LW92_SACKO|nr:PREDICTED: DNA fragmentation factor subunit beta-like [Saccoglossus kowalevskii]